MTTDLPTGPAAPPARGWLRRRWPYLAAALTAAVVAGVAGKELLRRPPPDPTLDRLDQAKAALSGCRFVEAQEHLKAVLEVWPLDAETHFLLARAYRRDDDLTGWERHLRAAAELQWPAEGITRERLFARVQSGDIRKGEAELTPTDDGGEDWAMVTEAMAKGYLAGYRLDPLLAITQTWIDRRSGDWPPYYLRGQGYLYGRLLARAVDEFRKVLERYPDHPTARLRLAGALMVDGLYEPARAEFETFLAARPQNPEALAGLANCLQNLARREDALATLGRLFAVAPDHPAGCYIRGQIEVLADPAAALEWYRRAERLAPQETDITSALIRALNQIGRPDEAARYQKRLDDMRDGLTRLDDLRREVRKEPDNTGRRFAAGELCAKLGRRGEAANWFESVLAIDPAHAAARKALDELTKPSAEAGRNR